MITTKEIQVIDTETNTILRTFELHQTFIAYMFKRSIVNVTGFDTIELKFID